MSKEVTKRSRALYFAMLGMLAVFSLGIWGCGTSGYDDPQSTVTTTKTATAAIDAATLNQWIAEGKVNSSDPSSRDKVVILTVSPAASYTAAHIPGAQLMNSDNELTMTRMEGLAPIATMVLDGGTIDTIIKRSGIDSNTTVVFTVSKGGSYLNLSRAYFTFRYWGFPKERLKVLNGGDDAWETAGYALVTDVPTVTGSTFSVRNNSAFAPELRYSIGQMISLVDARNASPPTKDPAKYKILDIRATSAANALSTTSYMTGAVVDYFDRYSDLPAPGKTRTFAVTDLASRLTEKDITAATTMTYVYCLSGMRASVGFFALDGILSWPVTLYDGSWNQWSAYRTGNSVNAAWRVDTVTPNTSVLRTTGAIAGSLTLDPLSNALFTSVADPRANQVLIEDTLYFNGGTSAAPPVSGGGDSSDC